jgi:pyruvate formate lyase activating enzyme
MSDSIHGIVFDIQKFSIHDGPGIRTTVFLKGCPLDCRWCHNPESKENSFEISYHAERCLGCGRYAQAVEVIGRKMTVESVLAEVMKDEPFYETSGGGMTVSGGEPMAQFAFTQALLAAAKTKGLHTCIETSGFATRAQYKAIYRNVDLFLYDLKETDPAHHQEWTGVALKPIRENLLALDRMGSRIILRCPIIPGMNDRADHLSGIAAVANELSHLIEIHLMPYHPLGLSKSERLGKVYSLNLSTFAESDQIQQWLEHVRQRVRVPVKQG